jgi:hypothetical protein
MAIKSGIFFLLISFLSYGKICTFDKKIEEKKLEIRNYNQKELDKFSLITPIQQESELILKKLIDAKSPMLLSWISDRKLDPSKPELLAMEWFKYYSKKFIIGSYSKNTPEIDNEIDLLFSRLLKYNFPTERQNKINSIFGKQKSLAINKIKSYPFSKIDQDALIKKISEIKIYWPTSLKDSKFKNHPLEFFDWSLAYDPKSNEINIGLNSPYYDENSMQVSLLHEIAHSFDSCRWSQNNSTPNPFEKVSNCLREFAAKRDDSKLEYLFKEKKLSETEFNFFKANPTCNNSIYPPIGIQADQLPETFADWFAAEAIEVSAINSKFRNELCTDTELNPGSSYLKNRDRYFKIYLANKKIQKSLNEFSNYLACEVK